MYKVHLLQYESKFNNVFNANPGNQGSLIILFFGKRWYLSGASHASDSMSGG
jgi:hypothetical protein